MDDVHDPWRRLVDGEKRAWDEAVALLFGRVRSFFANKVADSNEGDDLTQRTFDRLQRVRGSYVGRGSPRSFVFGIANLILMEYFREKRRDPRVPLDEISVAALDPRPSSVLVERLEQRLVLEALRRLTLEHQVVLELYYWEEMTDREIAEALDTNENTIRGRRTRARERMRVLLTELEQGGAPSSTAADFDRWARSVRGHAGVGSAWCEAAFVDCVVSDTRAWGVDWDARWPVGNPAPPIHEPIARSLHRYRVARPPRPIVMYPPMVREELHAAPRRRP